MADTSMWSRQLIRTELGRIKGENGALLQVHGSGELIQTLLAHDLIDEFRIWTFPVVVGEGKRLFDAGTPPRSLRLLRSAVTENGVAMSIYRRAL